MARFGLFGVRSRSAALVGWVLLAAAGCAGAKSQAASEPSGDSREVVACATDQVREYFCDDLLPLFSSRPAPEPYDSCPSAAEVRGADFEAIGQIASFDFSETAYTRRRVQPGHSCCYGWCAKVRVAEPARAAPSTCGDAPGLQQQFCMRELESGTSEPAPAPYDRCPGAIEPPANVTFAKLDSVRLDVAATSERRGAMARPDCCYSWCSRVPTGTVLDAQPKTK